MNKKDKPLIPLSGGIMVLGGIIFSLLSFIFIQTFIYKNNVYIPDKRLSKHVDELDSHFKT